MASCNGSEGFWDKDSSKTFFLDRENKNVREVNKPAVKSTKSKSPRVLKQQPSAPFNGFSMSSTPNRSISFEFSDESSSTPSFLEGSVDEINHFSNNNGSVRSVETQNCNNSNQPMDHSPTTSVSSTNRFLAGNFHTTTTSDLGQNNSYGGAKLKTLSHRFPTTIPIPSFETTNAMTRMKPARTFHKAKRRTISNSKENIALVVPDSTKHEDENSTSLTNGETDLASSFIKLGVSETSQALPVNENEIKEENGKEELISLENNITKLTILLRELDGVRALNDMRTVSMMVESLEKTVQSVRDTFKCEICFTPQYNYFYFCPDCGRMVGCYICAYQIDRCSTCRKRLPTRKNRVPHFIPGLASALDENEMTRDELKMKIEKLSSSKFF